MAGEKDAMWQLKVEVQGLEQIKKLNQLIQQSKQETRVPIDAKARLTMEQKVEGSGAVAKEGERMGQSMRAYVRQLEQDLNRMEFLANRAIATEQRLRAILGRRVTPSILYQETANSLGASGGQFRNSFFMNNPAEIEEAVIKRRAIVRQRGLVSLANRLRSFNPNAINAVESEDAIRATARRINRSSARMQSPLTLPWNASMEELDLAIGQTGKSYDREFFRTIGLPSDATLRRHGLNPQLTREAIYGRLVKGGRPAIPPAFVTPPTLPSAPIISPFGERTGSGLVHPSDIMSLSAKELIAYRQALRIAILQKSRGGAKRIFDDFGAQPDALRRLTDAELAASAPLGATPPLEQSFMAPGAIDRRVTNAINGMLGRRNTDAPRIAAFEAKVAAARTTEISFEEDALLPGMVPLATLQVPIKPSKLPNYQLPYGFRTPATPYGTGPLLSSSSIYEQMGIQLPSRYSITGNVAPSLANYQLASRYRTPATPYGGSPLIPTSGIYDNMGFIPPRKYGFMGGPPGLPPIPPTATGGGGFLEKFGGRFASLGMFVGASSIIFPIYSALSRSASSATQLEMILKRIQGIYGNHSLGEQLSIKSEIIKNASMLGENVDEVAKAAQQFAQEQIPIEDLGKDLQAAATGAKAFGLNVSEVADYIIAVHNATQGKVSGAQSVDTIAAIAKRGAVSPQNLMTAIQTLSPLMEEFTPYSGSITDQALIGSITATAARQARMTGSQVANALRFMMARFGSQKQAEKIEGLSGVELGTKSSQGQELRPFIEIMDDLSKAYQRLITTGSSAQAEALVRNLFGSRQVGPGTIILKQWTEILQTAQAGIEGTGAAADVASKQLDAFKSASDRVNTGLTNLWSNLIPYATTFLSIVNDIITALNNPTFQKFVKIGFTGLVGGGIGLKQIGKEEGKKIVPKVQSFVNKFSFYPIPNLPKQSLMFQGHATQGGAKQEHTVDELTGTIGGSFNTPTVTKTASAPTDTGEDLANFIEFSNKILKGTDAESKAFEKLGGSSDAAQLKLTKFIQAMTMYYDLINNNRNVTDEGRKRFQEDSAMASKIADTILQKSITKTTEEQQLRISIAQKQAAEALQRTQLSSFKSLRDVHGGTPSIGLDIQEINQTRDILKGEALDRYYARLKEIGNMHYQTAQARAGEVDAATATYVTDLQDIDIKQDTLILQTKITTETELQVKAYREMLEISNKFFNAVLNGLHRVPSAVKQAKDNRGNMFGAGLGALLEPVANTLASDRNQVISKAFSEGTLLPGVSKFLQNTAGRKTQDIQKQEQAIIMAQAAGTDPVQIKRLMDRLQQTKKLKAKQQLQTEAGIFLGQTISAATGGNSTGSMIGSEVGALAGNALLPGIGGLVGGALGGIVGGLFGGHKKPPLQITDLKIIAENTKEQVRLLENTNRLLEQNFVSFNVPTGFRLPSYQPSLGGGRAVSRGATGGVSNTTVEVNVNVGNTGSSAQQIGAAVAQAISDRLELEARSAGSYNPRLTYS